MKQNFDLKRNNVSRSGANTLTDAEIQAAVYEAIQWLTTIPSDTIRANVQDGWLNLEGTVAWWHQRDTLGEILRHVPGVKGLSNYLTLKSDVPAEQPA